jgi:zinc transport system ATP-binding protein
MSAAIVQLTGIGYSYGESPVLEDVTFRVEARDFFGIIGPNGAGKTTLLKIMLGLLAPTRGSVRLFGTSPPEFRDWRRVGYVPQKTFLDPTLPITAGEVVASGLLSRLRPFQRVGRDERRRTLEALALVGMDKHLSVRVGRLSAGQQQRVLIARALASQPEVVLLDEPAGGVDPEAQASLYRLLRRLHVDDGVTVVLVSHDIGVVAKEVTRLACLNGTLVFCGSPAAFLGHESLTQLYGSPVRVVPHRESCPHAS